MKQNRRLCDICDKTIFGLDNFDRKKWLELANPKQNEKIDEI